MKKIIVYGSLREGEYNFERMINAFGPDAIKKIKELTISGFKMYDIIHYPAVIKDDSDSTIVAELVEVSQECFSFIDRMEKGAGYYQDYAYIDNTAYIIYCIDKSYVSSLKQVKSGDWINKNKKYETEIN